MDQLSTVMIDVDVRRALSRIVYRLINEQRGTPARGIHTDLLEKRRVLEDLQTAGYLRISSGDYLPRFKLVAEIEPEISKIGFERVNAVLAALRNLYIREQERSQFSLDEITAGVKVLAPAFDRNDVIPGLFLAQDFGYFSGWTSTAGEVTFNAVTLWDSILDFTSAEETWQSVMAAEKELLRVKDNQTSLAPAADQGAPWADFAFVADDTLRGIIERDYAELRSNFMGTKSRIVITGGLIEALLLDALLLVEAEARNAKSAERDRRTKAVKAIDEWHLPALIDVAGEIGIITQDSKKHSATIREYRNLVHPGLERRASIAVRNHVANIAEQVLEMVIADIKSRAACKTQAASQGTV